MTAHQRYMQYRKDELYHFNPNHDPKDGKFTFAKGVRKIKNAANKVVRWIDAQDEIDAILAKKEAAERGEKNSVGSDKGVRATLNVNKLKKDFQEWDEKPKDPDAISPYHEMDGRFTPDPSKTRVISPGDRGALQEYMIEYVPGQGLFETKEKYRQRERKIEDELYQQYIDTSSIKDIKTKRSVEDRIFKEATLANRDPEKYNLKPGDDYHNTSVAAAIFKKVNKQSVDFYNGTTKTDEAHDLLTLYDNHHHHNRPKFSSPDFKAWLKEDRRLMKDLAKRALTECGYEPNETGADFMCEMWESL